VVLLSAGIGATPLWRCCTRWRRPARHGSLMATRGSRRQYHPFAAKSAGSCSRHARSQLCLLQQAGSATRWVRISMLPSPVAIDFRSDRVPRDADVYLCGPTRFMADMKEPLSTLAYRQIAFTSNSSAAASRYPWCRRRNNASSAPSQRRGRYRSRWSRSHAVASPHTWKAVAYQSILELAEACDVPVRWSCRTGVCHSCESGLVSGRRHGPEPLDKPADAMFSFAAHNPFATSPLICEH